MMLSAPTNQATASSVWRASAAATRASVMSVSATTACTPAASTSRARSSSPGVDHERAAELGVRAGDAHAADLDAERAHEPVGRALHRRARDDRADADDAVAAAGEHLADAGDRQDRADRDHRVRRADQDRLGGLECVEHAGRGAGVLDAVEVHGDHRGSRRARARTTPASRAPLHDRRHGGR